MSSEEKSVYLGESAIGGAVPVGMRGIQLSSLIGGVFPILKRGAEIPLPVYIADETAAEKEAREKAEKSRKDDFSAGLYPDTGFDLDETSSGLKMVIRISGNKATIDFVDDLKADPPTVLGKSTSKPPGEFYTARGVDILVYTFEEKEPIAIANGVDAVGSWRIILAIGNGARNIHFAQLIRSERQLTKSTSPPPELSPPGTGLTGPYALDARRGEVWYPTILNNTMIGGTHVPYKDKKFDVVDAVGMIDTPSFNRIKIINDDGNPPTAASMRFEALTAVYDRSQAEVNHALLGTLEWGFEWNGTYPDDPVEDERGNLQYVLKKSSTLAAWRGHGTPGWVPAERTATPPQPHEYVEGLARVKEYAYPLGPGEKDEAMPDLGTWSGIVMKK